MISPAATLAHWKMDGKGCLHLFNGGNQFAFLFVVGL